MSTYTEPAPRMRNRWALTGIAFAHLFLAVPAIVLFCLEITFIPLVIVTVGIPALLLIVPGTQWLATGYRVLAGTVRREHLESAYRSTKGLGPLRRLGVWALDPARWRDLVGLFLAFTVGLVIPILVIAMLGGFLFYLIYPFLWWVTPAGIFDMQLGLFEIDTFEETFIVWAGSLLFFALWWWTTGPLMRARAAMDKAIFSRSRAEELEERVQVLTETRAEHVDHSAAELRRIERDLHDGAQARLVALSMSLGLADSLMESDPETAQRMIADARSTSKAALGDLRSVVRGIHPPVLADRGIAGAVEALALDMPMPVRIDVSLRGRPPAPVESAVYFAVAECLANIGKHSAATNAWITLDHSSGVLRVTVGDDGMGGADPDTGTGMRGVMRRLSAFDGTMRVSSPVGGPTIVTMEVPCALSSPRTTPSSGPA
jgi:signal transduction histidine kinase